MIIALSVAALYLKLLVYVCWFELFYLAVFLVHLDLRHDPNYPNSDREVQVLTKKPRYVLLCHLNAICYIQTAGLFVLSALLLSLHARLK